MNLWQWIELKEDKSDSEHVDLRWVKSMDNIYISDVIKRLEKIKDEHGDLEVREWTDDFIEDINEHIWVEERDKDDKYLAID